MRHLVTAALIASCSSAVALAGEVPVTTRPDRTTRAFRSLSFAEPVTPGRFTIPAPPTLGKAADARTLALDALSRFSRSRACGMPVLPADPAVDPRMVKPPPAGKFAMRVIEPGNCVANGAAMVMTPSPSSKPDVKVAPASPAAPSVSPAPPASPAAPAPAPPVRP